jgi:hypothetical protein
VLRLSLLYALLDRSAFIDESHLRAALEIWRFVDESARFVFGDSLGDHIADTILASLRGNPEGLSRRDVSDLFGRNEDAARIKVAVDMLVRRGFVSVEKVATAGRPKEVLRAIALTRDYELNEFDELRPKSNSCGQPEGARSYELRGGESAPLPDSVDLEHPDGGCSDDLEPDQPAPFVVSAEWQEVPPGAVLPPGCRVEMDLATGVTRVRLEPEPDEPSRFKL